MIDHFGINCADLEASKRFHDAVLAPLGYTRQMDLGVGVGYGSDGHPSFWISGLLADVPNREMHLAFHADDAEACAPSTPRR
jgi:catechol 2,3-dioxygenase-like lactoylglutathione lyase family enzyme